MNLRCKHQVPALAAGVGSAATFPSMPPNSRRRQVTFRQQQPVVWQTGTSYGPSDLKHLQSAARKARMHIQN